MAKLLIVTQVYENYAWDDDGVLGTGENAYWKAKGGDEYVVPNFTAFDRVTEVVMALRNKIEADTVAYRETIVDFEIVADDYLTEYEKNQLEFDGRITYPAKELELEFA